MPAIKSFLGSSCADATRFPWRTHGAPRTAAAWSGAGPRGFAAGTRQTLIASCSREPKSLAAGGAGSLAQEHGAGGTMSQVSHRVPAQLHQQTPAQPPAPCLPPRVCLHGSAVPAGPSACSAPRLPQRTLILAKCLYSSSRAQGAALQSSAEQPPQRFHSSVTHTKLPCCC